MTTTDVKNIDCTLIILSYNTKDVTYECLAKAQGATEYSRDRLHNRADIILVDNGSKDGSVEMVRERYPAVNLIALEQNAGYSQGNNRAMEIAKTPFILLLNSDSFLRRETIVKAIAYMQEHPRCDILSAKLVYPDGSFQAFSGYLPTPFRTIRWAFMAESVPLLKNIIRPLYQYKKSFYAKERQLDWATTGFFFMRKEVYKKTGGFDELLFLYMEDVEWCQRIKNNHLTICYSPTIDIVHLGGFSAKKLPNEELLRRHLEGVKHFHTVHYPKMVWIVMFSVMLGMRIRAILYTLILQPKKAKPYWDVIGLQKKYKMDEKN